MAMFEASDQNILLLEMEDQLSVFEEALRLFPQCPQMCSDPSITCSIIDQPKHQMI